MVLDGITHQLRGIAQAEFGEDVGAVGVHRAHTDEQLVRDLFGTQALRNFAKDFRFPAGKPGFPQFGVEARPGDRVFQKMTGNPAAEEDLP